MQTNCVVTSYVYNKMGYKKFSLIELEVLLPQ